MSSRCARRFHGRWRCAVSVVKKYGRLLGTLLSFVCLAWIVCRFAAGGVLGRVIQSGRGGDIAMHVFLAAAIYGAGVVMLALAWWFLQRAFAGSAVRVLPTMGAYLLTQFGKYLPGNVVQYVGRHVLLRNKGLGHTALVCCTLAEAGLLAASATLFAAPLLHLYLPIATPGRVVGGALAGVVAAMGVFAFTRARVAWLRRTVDVFVPWRLLVSLALYLIFFAVMGLTLLAVADREVQFGPSRGFLIAVAALSWLAGYFVIGAPAGLGVREAVFLALLKGALPEDAILLLVAAFRAATFGGDLLAFLLALPFVNAIKGGQASDHPDGDNGGNFPEGYR